LLAAPASAQGVKIGVLNDQSSVYADYGGKYSVEAAKMTIGDFGGEVLGQKIELVTADHQNKPDRATSIARRWCDAEGVDMIPELTTSPVALAVQELSKEKKKSTSWWERRPRPSPAARARPMASIGLSTPTRSRSVPAARW
jgi:branched-chain amino acid transport system substrate-binding protein